MINASDHWTGGDTTVVQIGDVLDRGGDEIKILYFLEKFKREASKCDLPGFYFDAKKNRYFPIKGRIPGSSSHVSKPSPSKPEQVIEQSRIFEADALRYGNMSAIVTRAVGEMAISKGRQGREAQNLVKVYLANVRLKGVSTDVLITAYEPILINSLSESAVDVGAGLTVPATQSGCLPMSEVFKLAVSSFKVHD